MRTSKKIVSLVLAVMMVVTMMSVMAVSASAVSDIATEAQLKAAIAAGGEYNLTADILDAEAYTIKADEFILHGNGHKIVSGGTVNNYKYMFYLPEKKTQTIKMDNVTIDGTWGEKQKTYAFWRTQTNPYTIDFDTVTVKNFKGENQYGALYLFGNPTAKFTNCTITGNGSACKPYTDGSSGRDIWVGSGGNVTINGGTYGEILLNSGTSIAASADVKNATIDTLYLDKEASVPATANLHTGTEDASTVNAVLVEGVLDVAASSNSAEVNNFADFKTAVESGKTYIVVTGAFEISGDVDLPATANTTIDFGANTVTVAAPSGSNWKFENYGTLTLKGTTGGLTGTYGLVDNYGVLTVASGNYTATTDLTDKVAVWNNGNATTNILGGKFDTTCYGVYVGTGDVVNVSGGEIISHEASCLSGNGTTGQGGYTMNVTGGKLTSENSAAIYHPNEGSLNISYSPKVTGHPAIFVKCGETNITGGTFQGTGTVEPFVHNGDGVNGTGEALVVEHCNYPGGTPTVNISGGTFKSEGGKAIASEVQNDSYSKVTDFITKGSFFDDSAYEFIVDSSYAYKGSAGNVTVSTALSTTKTTITNGELGIPDGTKFTNYQILGFQTKIENTQESSEAEGNDINTAGVRFVTAVNEGFVKGGNIAEYGYVVAKVGDNVTPTENTYNALTVDGGNGQKVINCKGSSNSLCGDYGKYEPATTYKFVTLAVNAMTAGQKAIARFYVKTNDGNVLYSNGAVAAMS